MGISSWRQQDAVSAFVTTPQNNARCIQELSLDSAVDYSDVGEASASVDEPTLELLKGWTEDYVEAVDAAGGEADGKADGK